MKTSDQPDDIYAKAVQQSQRHSFLIQNDRAIVVVINLLISKGILTTDDVNQAIDKGMEIP